MRYKARAPVRIDFGGGWTDVPVFAEVEGGNVLNAAITQYVRGSLSRVDSEASRLSLRRERNEVSYETNLPSGSGLGTSAAQTVLWATLVRSSFANTADRVELAEMACRISSILGIVGGKQDEYASSLGGIHYFSFTDRVQADRLDLGPSVLNQLRSRLVLVYSGENRLSGAIHQHVWTRYREGDIGVIGALRALKRIAGDMRTALEEQQIEAFGRLLTENWLAQKSLHPSVTNPKFDGIMNFAFSHGAIGGKACGAGGGGCAVFMAAEGAADSLRTSLQAQNLSVIPFDFDTYGVFLTKG